MRWRAVDAKDASDIPAGSTALPTDGFKVVNLDRDYRANEDVILAFGSTNLFNGYDVR